MAKEKTNLNRKLLAPFKGDLAIWFIFIALAIISLISVYSSIGYSAIISGTTPIHAFLKHLLFVVATLIGVIFIANFNYRRFASLSWFGYILSVALLVGVLLIGHKENTPGSGMNRWIDLPLIGHFQPSELAKIVIIVYLARLIALEKTTLHEWKTFRRIGVSVLIVIALILPDNLSTAVIIGFVCLAMLRLSPINVTHWRRTVLALIVIGVLAIMLGSKMNFGPLARSSTWASRIDNWVNFNDDELTQESMARMAVASGKFFGVGIGSTVQARLMTQAHNDLIYAIIIEESGMLGGIIVFLLYAYLYLRCIRIAWQCKGTFGRMTVVGLGTLIFLQAAIHMGVSVGALPITGQNLPFISSGGTAYLCMGLALGIIQAVAHDVNRSKALAESSSTQQQEDDIKEERERMDSLNDKDNESIDEPTPEKTVEDEEKPSDNKKKETAAEGNKKVPIEETDWQSAAFGPSPDEIEKEEE